jgi:KDO2-lipid IV(A) lauroyltransferase
MRKALEFFSFVLMVLFSLPFALLPHALSLKIGEGTGVMLYYIWTRRRLIAIENLRSAVSRGAVKIDSAPETVIKQNFRNMGKSFVEIVKIYYGFGKKIFERVEIRGVENYRNAQSKGKGVIAITGHCGNWELNALASSTNLTRVNVVARALNNSYLNKLMEKTRKKYGNTVIYKKGALKKILSALKRNEAVVILMDQSVVSSEAVAADFLGKKDHIMKMPAIIARKTGSPVLPVFGRRVGKEYLIEIGDEIELDKTEDYEEAVYNDTVRFSGHIENYIKNNPTEWLWIHHRWKRDKSLSREII